MLVFVVIAQLQSIYRRVFDDRLRRRRRVCVSSRDKRDKTLSGGSLGSCVDEERSQLREVM